MVGHITRQRIKLQADQQPLPANLFQASRTSAQFDQSTLQLRAAICGILGQLFLLEYLQRRQARSACQASSPKRTRVQREGLYCAVGTHPKVAASEHGKRFLVVYDDTHLELRDMDSGDLVTTLDQRTKVQSIISGQATPVISRELVVALDGGVSSVLSTAGTAQIDSARSVFILFPTPLKDYRVRMFDGAEQVLASDEEARAEDGGMSYRIVLAAPLKPGRAYSFSVEAELGHEITDFSGRGYRDVRVGLRVRGEPEAEPKKKPGNKRHK